MDASDHDAVWAETGDGGLLHQLFGYYPTLHDATIQSVSYSRAADRLEMILDYEDEAEGDAPLRARISLTWTGVESALLGMEDRSLMSLRFRRAGGKIVTRLKTLDQTDGEVVAEGVEARLVALGPDAGDDKPVLFRLE